MRKEGRCFVLSAEIGLIDCSSGHLDAFDSRLPFALHSDVHLALMSFLETTMEIATKSTARTSRPTMSTHAAYIG